MNSPCSCGCGSQEEHFFYNMTDEEQRASEERWERLEERKHRESSPYSGVYPPCNLIKPTTLAVITGRSEDGTMFYCKGGMWTFEVEQASIINYGIAARYVRMRKFCKRLKPNGEYGYYGCRVRRVGIES